MVKTQHDHKHKDTCTPTSNSNYTYIKTSQFLTNSNDNSKSDLIRENYLQVCNHKYQNNDQNNQSLSHGHSLSHQLEMRSPLNTKALMDRQIHLITSLAKTSRSESTTLPLNTSALVNLKLNQSSYCYRETADDDKVLKQQSKTCFDRLCGRCGYHLNLNLVNRTLRRQRREKCHSDSLGQSVRLAQENLLTTSLCCQGFKPM